MANEEAAVRQRLGADAQGTDSSRADEDARRLSASSRCSVVLPAGAGKTQLIAKAILHNSRDEGRQLILTHTHAGVAALKGRLRRLGVPGGAYRILTLDGFALRFTRHYPILAGTRVVEPANGREWEGIRHGAASALRSKHLRSVLRESFSGVYVDEYQDCGTSQHLLVLLLAEELPTRAVGDPLQGIFSFDGSVDWRKDVAAEFPRLSVSEIAWRWKATNPVLGERLLQIRRCLINGDQFTLHPGDVIAWRLQHHQTQVEVCHEAAEAGSEVVALHKWAGQCHGIAKKLNGSYSSMEDLAGGDLVRAAQALDDADGAKAAIELIEFAKKCRTRLPQGLTAAQEQYRKGKRPQTHVGRKHREVYEALNNLADDDSPSVMLQAMTEIDTIPDTFTHRRECWGEMKRALRIRQTEPGVGSLREAVLRVRERTRRTGRVAQRKTISRTLLVKGLEYDHCIVLDADQLKDARELYVALTRGRSAVTVLSSSRKFSRPPVFVE